MGIRHFFRNLFGRNVEIRINQTSFGVMGMDAADLYRTQPALRAVVSFLSDNVAGLPLHAYLRNSDTDRPRDTESALALLLLRPSEAMTSHELIRATCSDYLLHGNALWYPIESNETESGYEIVYFPWSWVTQDSTFDGMFPVEFTITNPVTGRSQSIPARDCIHFRQYDPNGDWDSSAPVEALKQVLSEQISAWNFRNSTWKNGGRISAWLFRPKDAPPWSPDAKNRFVKSWKAKFAGEDGTDTGGTPLLEDGMELRTTQFNAREAQWVEATTLTREDVSAVYHVNPALIWHTDGQSYASAKDNARQLYADTLSPILDMFEERINAFLVPRLGVDPRSYVAFDLSAKLAGSFEERASVIQSAVGGPWMTRNEARAMNDLPAIEGGDELIVPLNVIEGGLASPNDTDPTIERFTALPEAKSEGTVIETKASEEDSGEIAEILKRFFKRQKTSVLNSMNQKANEDWWNQERWERELSDDLFPALLSQSTQAARRALARAGIRPSLYDEERTEAYIRTISDSRSRAINETTKRELDESLDGDFSDDAEQSTPEGVFDYAISDRSEVGGVSMATAVSGWGVLEGLRQAAPNSGAMKTWVVNSGNPRPSHEMMDGETVPFDEEFSNGAAWPGDQGALDVADVANCQCSLEITIP